MQPFGGKCQGLRELQQQHDGATLWPLWESGDTHSRIVPGAFIHPYQFSLFVALQPWAGDPEMSDKKCLRITE